MKAKKSTGRPVVNRYKVPQRVWRKWSSAGQRMFNELYYRLRPHCQWIYMHPKAVLLSKEMWQTTRYNVAFEAADAASKIAPKTVIAIIDGKGKELRRVKVRK